MLLQEWANSNKPNDDLIYKDGYWSQIIFVRDNIVGLMGVGLDYEDRQNIATVISTHRSKSVVLPVYSLERKDIGLQFVLRYNYFNWKLSVISAEPIDANFDGLFYTTSPVDPKYTGNQLANCYFEGFPNDLIFGYYAESNHKKWSAELGGNYDLWTAIFLIMRARGIIKPAKWHTQESHRAELNAKMARWEARRCAACKAAECK